MADDSDIGAGLEPDELEDEEPQDIDEEGEEDDDEELGMEDDEDFPAYANEQNKELNSVIKEKERFLKRFSEEIEDIEERVKILTEHNNNVAQELVSTQDLVDQNNKKIDTENHLKQVAERKTGRLFAELQKLEQRAADQQDRLNNLQNQIFKGNERMDQYKLEMNWNQEELEQWALASRQKEEDFLTLEKYKRADESKIKELTLHIEKLTIDVKKNQAELEKEVTKTQAKQIELDKTAEEFKRLHYERHELSVQLRDALGMCQRRDEEIRLAGEQFASDKLRIRQKQDKMTERSRFLSQQVSDNQKTESEIKLVVRQLANKRLDYINVQQQLEDAKARIEILRNRLSADASEVANKRIQFANLTKGLADMKCRLDKAQKKYEQTMNKLRSATHKTDNLESGSKIAEDMFKQAEDNRDGIEKKIASKKNELFKLTQELLILQQKEATTYGEISSAIAAGRNLQAQINKLDNEVQQQQELLYAADYLIQTNARRVEQAKGDHSNEDNKKYVAKLQKKQKKLEDVEKKYKILFKSVKKLNDDLRGVKRDMEKSTEESTQVSESIDQLQLEIEMTEREIDGLGRGKEDVLVKHDVMKLEVKNRRDVLFSAADTLFTLENRKYQLEMSMEERMREITVHKDVLNSEKRACAEEKHKVMVELADRKARVQNLKIRFENLCSQNKAKEDGEERTQAYYVIKAAQEREELQRYGDELDAKIKKSEKEIRSLSLTLNHLKSRNTNYRDSFKKMGNEEEKKTKVALEDQVQGARELMFRRRKELSNLQHDWEVDKRRLMELQTKSDMIRRQMQTIESSKEQMQSSVTEQRSKLDRANRFLGSVRRDLPPESPQYLNIQLHVEQNKSRNLLGALNMLCSEFPEVSHLLEGPLAEHGLKIPSRPATAESSVRSN